MSNTKKPLIGLDKFHYAILTTDTEDALVYQTPVPLIGAVTVNVNPNSVISVLDADNVPYVSVSDVGDTDVEVNLVDVSQEIEAELMGQTITGGVVVDNRTDDPPYVAIAFRGQRSDSAYSYVWLLKGKFGRPVQGYETRKRGESAFKTPMLVGKFSARIYDGHFKHATRTDADNYTAALGTTWFDAVQGTTADTTAPTFTSSVPSAASTSGAATAAVTIVFSEPLMTSTLTAANILFVNTTSAATVAATSFTRTSATVTVAHNTFSSGSTYNMILNTGLKDEMGNAISAVQTIRFTLA